MIGIREKAKEANVILVCVTAAWEYWVVFLSLKGYSVYCDCYIPLTLG
jgi:hypothetical protein